MPHQQSELLPWQKKGLPDIVILKRIISVADVSLNSDIKIQP